MKRVVITGMGIYSCLGTDLETVKQSLFDGKSGIISDPARKEMGFRSSLTGFVPKPELKKEIKRKKRVRMSEHAEYAYCATRDAFAQAGIDDDFLEKSEIGIFYGNDSSARATIETTDILRETKDTALIGSSKIFQSMNSTVTMNLSVIFKLKGVNFTISGACASGSHAIGLGYTFIRNGMQECIVCGGAQEMGPHSVASFDALSAFSIIEPPQNTPKPFDKNRDGLVPGGGAATLILESLEHAKKRGATILAEVIGYGFSSNGEHISVPNVDGPARSLTMALKDADLQPEDIDYINAHATGTPVGDSNEADAIYKVFGDNPIPVSSTKSMTGHEMWMAGASEVVYSILMMQNSFVAPNINFSEPDESSKKIAVTSKTLNKNIDIFLSNSFGFGGTNSTLIVKKFQGK